MNQMRSRTPRWLSAVIGLPLMVAVLAGCGDDDDTTAAGSDDVSTDTAAETATEAAGGDAVAGEQVTIDIVSTTDGFDPSTVEVAVGSEVTWVNGDDTVHTSTAEDGTWDSGQLEEGAVFTFTAEEPGTYPYVCDIHPSMKGELVVE